jgi:hypothetical protein
MLKKAGKRLRYWGHLLSELRTFCFYGEDDFNKWSADHSKEPELLRPLSKAANFFHLDEKNAAHRKLLLGILADALFGDPRRAGRPKRTKWNSKKLIQLWHDWAEVKNDTPEITDAKATQIIKDRHRGRYQLISPEMLRQRLIQARKEARRLDKRKREMAEARRNGDEIRYVALKYGAQVE